MGDIVPTAPTATRAATAAAKKSKGSANSKERVEGAGAGPLGPQTEDDIVETQDNTNPGIAPVDKDAGEELIFEEAVESRSE
ncbi:hypothetical protein PtA15_2A697 [Puccinia triticina]|uniref:Histone chaperone domain-containing protein n=1 Tax=Puccinia triticina TaxID=208348 RepID=A0ABY7CC95_9BASI|nr:uncharacterized protein PtA15_2A697 [Puccinia triticina]WAQ82380.1 hypothetical protein PtA15_2A697 [Puccinia triticina]WAR53236.1 hypothetical protein PtB15_2B667 [Puccinia triticina]